MTDKNTKIKIGEKSTVVYDPTASVSLLKQAFDLYNQVSKGLKSEEMKELQSVIVKIYSLVGDVRTLQTPGTVLPVRTKKKNSVLNSSSSSSSSSLSGVVKMTTTDTNIGSEETDHQFPSIMQECVRILGPSKTGGGNKRKRDGQNAPTVALNAPTVTLNAPTVTLNAPTVTLNAPTGTLNAPTGTLNAPTVTLNAPTVTLNTPTVTLNAPTVVLDAPTAITAMTMTSLTTPTSTSPTTITLTSTTTTTTTTTPTLDAPDEQAAVRPIVIDLT